MSVYTVAAIKYAPWLMSVWLPSRNPRGAQLLQAREVLCLAPTGFFSVWSDLAIMLTRIMQPSEL